MNFTGAGLEGLSPIKLDLSIASSMRSNIVGVVLFLIGIYSNAWTGVSSGKLD